MATAARDLMNGAGSPAGPVAWSLAATAAVVLVCAPVTLRLYAADR
ncbi:hypothetical protein [Actinacidiphila reveromycinica]|nr:hypothetical protein [Streptomyces sp. SN-593]